MGEGLLTGIYSRSPSTQRSAVQLYLLGYSVDEAIRLVYLEAVGPQENFYRDIKR